MVAGSVLTSLSGYLDATAAQMPMVALASRLNPALGIVYGMLLLFGMFSNALASLVAFMEYMNSNICVLNTHRKSTMAVLMVLVGGQSGRLRQPGGNGVPGVRLHRHRHYRVYLHPLCTVLAAEKGCKGKGHYRD